MSERASERACMRACVCVLALMTAGSNCLNKPQSLVYDPNMMGIRRTYKAPCNNKSIMNKLQKISTKIVLKSLVKKKKKSKISQQTLPSEPHLELFMRNFIFFAQVGQNMRKEHAAGIKIDVEKFGQRALGFHPHLQELVTSRGKGRREMSDCYEHKTRLVTHVGVLGHSHFEQIFEEEMVEISLSM